MKINSEALRNLIDQLDPNPPADAEPKMLAITLETAQFQQQSGIFNLIRATPSPRGFGWTLEFASKEDGEAA